MTSAQGDFILIYHIEHVNNLRSITGDALQSNVRWLFVAVIDWQLILQDRYFLPIFQFNLNGEPLLTKFTF